MLDLSLYGRKPDGVWKKSITEAANRKQKRNFISGMISKLIEQKLVMNQEKKPTDKKETETKKSGTVETPPPPQHMDPSKKPHTEKSEQDSKRSTPKK